MKKLQIYVSIFFLLGLISTIFGGNKQIYAGTSQNFPPTAIITGSPGSATNRTVVNFSGLAREEALLPKVPAQQRAIHPPLPGPANRSIPGKSASQRSVINLNNLSLKQALSPPVPKQSIAIHAPLQGPAHPNIPSTGSSTGLYYNDNTLKSMQLSQAPLSPAPSDNFLALDEASFTPTGWDVIPPDTMGAVSPNYLMVSLNSQVRIQQRNGTPVNTVTLNNFWSSLGNPSVFDPRLLYDCYGQRWIIVSAADGFSTTSSVLIGVSQTSDPTGNWNLYRIPVDLSGTLWADYPSVGFNKDWIVVQVNMFTISGGSFSRSNIYVFNKADLYSGGSGLYTLLEDTTGGFSQAPAFTYDNTLGTMYLLEDWNGDVSGNGYLRLSKITGTVGSEVLTTGIALPSIAAPWADFGPNAPQLGTSITISTNDSRMQKLVYRNGSLWAAQTIFLPASTPNRSSVQWWQISATSYSVSQYGRIDDSTGTNFYAFPSIDVNANNDMLIGYSSFSSNQYASADYSFRDSSDPTGTTQSNYIFKAGQGIYYKTFGGGTNRWGDYSNTIVDPVNDLGFWTIQEYAATPGNPPTTDGNGMWSTWWAHVVPPVIPVVLSSFSATSWNNKITIQWETSQENSNAGFYIFRSTDNVNYLQLNTSLIAPNQNNYTYTDNNVVNGTKYYYKLKDVSLSGPSTMQNEVVWAMPSPADIDGSQIVDGNDLIILSQAMGSKYGMSNWNPKADLNGDGVVDTQDLQILQQYFGDRLSGVTQ